MTGWTKRVVSMGTLAVAGLGCGPAKPVLVYVPASVTIDPGGSAPRAGKVVSRSRTFWEAMSSLDTGFVTRQPATDGQRAFARALGLIMAGRTEDAAFALDSVRTTFPDDTLINSASRVLMTAMLQYQDKWKLLSELAPGTKRDTTMVPDNKADVESWASAFRTVGAREMSFPKAPVIVPLFLSVSGTPMISVKINGKERLLWLDTGSSMSIVASDVAEECGVRALISDTLEVATTTGRVPARPAAIAHLQLGGISVRNATAMIVAENLMQVRLDDAMGSATPVKIDGVIGFDIMSRLDIRIDYVNRRVTLLKPDANAKVPRGGRNLFWVGTPVVRLMSSGGVPLHFNLDTGAQETYSTEGLVVKTKAKTFRGERRLIGGFAGLTIVHGRFINEMHLTMGGQRLSFRKVLVFAPAFSSFVSLDGVLGSDVGKAGLVRIDATNGLFLLEPQKLIRGLRNKS